MGQLVTIASNSPPERIVRLLVGINSAISLVESRAASLQDLEQLSGRPTGTIGSWFEGQTRIKKSLMKDTVKIENGDWGCTSSTPTMQSSQKQALTYRMLDKNVNGMEQNGAASGQKREPELKHYIGATPKVHPETCR